MSRKPKASPGPDPAADRPPDFGPSQLSGSIPEAVVVADAASGRILLWNRAAEQMFGYTVAEAMALTVDALVPERLRPRHVAGRSNYASTGAGSLIEDSVPLELLALHRSGVEFPVELTLSAAGSDSLGGRLVMAITRDATERRRSNEARFRSLVQSVPDLVTILGPDGTIRYVSASIERMLGYRPADVVGGNAFDLVHPDDRARVRRLLSHTRSAWGWKSG